MKINELKHDLAAAFRWTARLNMNEGIANHYSVCLPNSNDFYVNGSGLHFSSIKASDMVLVEQDKIEEIKNNPELVEIYTEQFIEKCPMQDVYFMFIQNTQLPYQH